VRGARRVHGVKKLLSVGYSTLVASGCSLYGLVRRAQPAHLRTSYMPYESEGSCCALDLLAV
jgi:hypothetical protein